MPRDLGTELADEKIIDLRPGNDDAPTLLPLLRPADWEDAQPRERAWAVEGWAPDRQTTLLTGKGSAGKSLIGQQLATCCAAGIAFLGTAVSQRPALYLSCEDDNDELHRRQIAICRGAGLSLTSLDSQLYLASLQGELGNELATFTAEGNLRPTDRYQQIIATAKAYGIRLLILDNSAHLFGGNENDRHQVAAFVNLLNRLAREIDGAVILIGHPNKAGESFSGSTAWENQVRSRLFMEIPAVEDGIPDPDARVIRREKANYAVNGTEIRFRWHQGSFILDGDLPADQSAETAANLAASADNATFLACLAERNRQRRAVSEKRSPSFAPSVFVTMPESRRIGKERLDAAMDRLFRTGQIERAFLWRDVEKSRDVFGLVQRPPNGTPKRPDNTLPEHPQTVGEMAEMRPQTPPQHILSSLREDIGVPLQGALPSISFTETEPAKKEN